MNRRDAFSHSQQCDAFFSVISSLVGGVPHVKCQCWCHNAENLFSSPEPEYDLTPPPEYLNSADMAFILDEPAHVRVGFSNEKPVTVETLSTFDPEYSLLPGRNLVSPDQNVDNLAAFSPAPEVQRSTPAANRSGSINWSAEELRSGKCATCDDPLVDCECVE